MGSTAVELRLLLEPVVQLPGLGRVLWIEVELGGQPLFEPVAEGLAKTGGHAAGTDVGRQRQQQRHQCQAQGRQLLAAIGDKPLAEHRTTALQQPIEHGIEHHRQRQRGAEQQRRPSARNHWSGCRRAANASNAITEASAATQPWRRNQRAWA